MELVEEATAEKEEHQVEMEDDYEEIDENNGNDDPEWFCELEEKAVDASDDDEEESTTTNTIL